MSYKTVKYSEIGTIRSGKRLPKGFLVTEDRTNNRYIRVRDISDGKVKTDEVQFISDEAASKISKYIVNTDDVIISVVGTVGAVASISEDLDGSYLTENCNNLLVDENICCKKYLKYYLLSEKGKQEITSNTVGSTQPKLPIYGINNFDIYLPDLGTQKRIVRILSALDQKIELNNQESENLRKIIKTLYGNTVTSIKEKTKLADLAKISSGKRPISIETNGEYAVVGARDVMGFTNDYNQDPEVIITGRVGTLGVVKRYQKKTWASDNTLIVDTRYKNFIECYLSSVDFGAYNRGSTQPLITQTDLKNFVLPFDKEKCDSFENKTTSLRNKMFAIEEQNEELIKLRDTLLPRLIEGTMDLNKVGL